MFYESFADDVFGKEFCGDNSRSHLASTYLSAHNVNLGLVASSHLEMSRPENLNEDRLKIA